MARADLLGDGAGHDADRPGSGDQDVFSHQIEGQGGMGRVAEGIEDRRDVVGQTVGQLVGVVRGDRQRYSAKAPGPVDADALVLRQRCSRPARQLRQCAADDVPSPEIRSPGAKSSTSSPTSTISPTNSWPIVIGTGMVFCDQSSHL